MALPRRSSIPKAGNCTKKTRIPGAEAHFYARNLTAEASRCRMGLRFPPVHVVEIEKSRLRRENLIRLVRSQGGSSVITSRSLVQIQSPPLFLSSADTRLNIRATSRIGKARRIAWHTRQRLPCVQFHPRSPTLAASLGQSPKVDQYTDTSGSQ